MKSQNRCILGGETDALWECLQVVGPANLEARVVLKRTKMLLTGWKDCQEKGKH